MSEKTKIAWCDSTASPWTGCTQISAGCQNCYAADLAKRYGWAEFGKGKLRHRFTGFEKTCLAMNRKPWVCQQCGEYNSSPDYCDSLKCGPAPVQRRRRVFPSLMDFLDHESPIEWLAWLFDVIRRCPDLDFLLLTKRPESWKERAISAFQAITHLQRTPQQAEQLAVWLENWTWGNGLESPPHNIWLGVTAENQEQADKRIPELLKIPARVRFLSCEPLLTSINLGYRGAGGLLVDGAGDKMPAQTIAPTQVDWTIIGCESGPHRRNQQDVTEHARYIVQQCKAACVPVFVKQLPVNGKVSHNPAEWPSDLQVQEFPTQP